MSWRDNVSRAELESLMTRSGVDAASEAGAMAAQLVGGKDLVVLVITRDGDTGLTCVRENIGDPRELARTLLFAAEQVMKAFEATDAEGTH